MCLAADGVHLPHIYLQLLHAGGGGAGPVYHSQNQGAALCLQPAGEPPGEHAAPAGLLQGLFTVYMCVGEGLGKQMVITDKQKLDLKQHQYRRKNCKIAITSLLQHQHTFATHFVLYGCFHISILWMFPYLKRVFFFKLSPWSPLSVTRTTD